MRRRYGRMAACTALATALISGAGGIPASWAAPGAHTSGTTVAAHAASTQTFRQTDGSTATVGASGLVQVHKAHGLTQSYLTMPEQGVSAEGPLRPDKAAIARQLASDKRGLSAPNSLIVAFRHAAVTGSPLGSRTVARKAVTSDAAVNRVLKAIDATSISPLLGSTPATQVASLAQAARTRLGPSTLDLSHVDVVHLHGQNSAAAAATLRSNPDVAYVEPDFYVEPMDVAPTTLPRLRGLRSAPTSSAAPGKPVLPSNFGLQSSLQSFLNAGGVDAMGAYARLKSQYGQLPGQGETITNVSLGDLISTDMSRSGNDAYASEVGPTTVSDGAQRYLDLPSMPLIPTFTAGPDGRLDPMGTTEHEDSTLGEVMLDFGVMAPLPHDQQRPAATGAGATDILGIAPGARYRLVVPQQPTGSQIAGAILAAATQTPRPDVINASLGYGSDAVGFPGRYLEDDPVQQAVIAAVVQKFGIVMSIAVNDGTRLVTPAAVGPDGGSTPTDLAGPGHKPTSIADDYYSTTPSRVIDSGAITVGGTTTDDTIAVPPQSGGRNGRTGAFAETRISGATTFSSGFGDRVDVSAPSDAIVSFLHPQVGGFGSPRAVTPVLSGGTSASAPMVAAAAAVALQTARLNGRHLDPLQVRSLLQRTARAVPTPPQIDRSLNVGPQIDITAAVDDLLAHSAPEAPRIVRVSVAHRQELGNLGGTFMEATDPSNIDLTTDAGQDLFGPITFAADVTGGHTSGDVRYRLEVGTTDFNASVPSVRVTPAELLTAAGQHVTSPSSRTVQVTFQMLRGHTVVAQYPLRVGLSGSSGTHPEALAPVVPPVIHPNRDVLVHYDLTGVSGLNRPELVVSTAGHWSPAAAPSFHTGYSVPLTRTSGTIRVPRQAFANGEGIYGVGILQDSVSAVPYYGQFTPVRLDAAPTPTRPDAPLLTTTDGNSGGHLATLTRAHPQFDLTYDVSHVPGAAGARMEVSAPAPTLYRALLTFSNPNGTIRDDNGVDTGSVIYQRLGGVRGTAPMDALQVGLSTSLDYSVRIVPVDREGRPVGQASATSFLKLDDGLLPDGATLEDFAMSGHGDAVASTHTVTPNIEGITNSTLRRYSPTTGTYGPPIAEDAQGHTLYGTYGTDPTLGSTVVGARSLVDGTYLGTDQSIQTYDLATGAKLTDTSLEPQSLALIAGQVDPQRHRATIVARRYPEATSHLVPFDIATGTMKAPIAVDPPGGKLAQYGSMDIDEKSGKAVLASGNVGGECMHAHPMGKFVSVDPASGEVSPIGDTDPCVTGVAAGQNGHDDYVTSGIYGGILLTALDGTVIPVDENSASRGTGIDVTSTPNVISPVVDPVHHVMLVGSPIGNDLCPTPRGCRANNNPMSSVVELDLTTGKIIKKMATFNLLGAVNPLIYGDFFTTRHNIQIDPKTRTAWTFGPNGRQIQQFSY